MTTGGWACRDAAREARPDRAWVWLASEQGGQPGQRAAEPLDAQRAGRPAPDAETAAAGAGPDRPDLREDPGSAAESKCPVPEDEAVPDVLGASMDAAGPDPQEPSEQCREAAAGADRKSLDQAGRSACCEPAELFESEYPELGVPRAQPEFPVRPLPEVPEQAGAAQVAAQPQQVSGEPEARVQSVAPAVEPGESTDARVRPEDARARDGPSAPGVDAAEWAGTKPAPQVQFPRGLPSLQPVRQRQEPPAQASRR